LITSGFHLAFLLKKLKKRTDKDMMRTYIVVGMPAFFTSVITSLGRVLFTAMIIPLGTSVYAAHSISFTAESAFYIPAVGMASAVAVLSGNVKGEGDQKKLNHQTNLVCVLIIVIMLMATTIMLLFANSIISIFTTDAYILKTSPVLLRIVALNEPFFGVSIVMQNVFNGIGKTKPPLIISAFTQWCVRILGVFIFVSILGFGIKTAWLCMVSDNIVRAILLYSWYWICMKGESS
jgi:Na+-driven multidrug efflux pump